MCGACVRLSYPGKKPEAEVLATPPPATDLPLDGSECEQASIVSILAIICAVLAGLLDDTAVRGKVRLVYIDPPFATQTTFHSRKLDHAYEDTLAGPDFIESLRWRLILLRELAGSRWLDLSAS